MKPRATGNRAYCYKLHDNNIRAVIGQKSGQSSKFDIMNDQSTWDRRYSSANLEYGRCFIPRAADPHLFRGTAGPTATAMRASTPWQGVRAWAL